MSRREQISRVSFLKTIIREYYKRRPLEEPPNLHKREIALESLEDGVYIRHLAFPYIEQLYNYILSIKTPLHLYYSSALYANPSAQLMEDKSWEGSELLFDIDADKYLECVTKLYICSDGTLLEESVDKCVDGSKPLEYVNVSWNCIVKAWSNVITLVDVLRRELGFREMRVFFSGNRGFHVKVVDEKALLLGRDERMHIAGYVTCEDLRVDKMFPAIGDKVIFSTSEHGLRKRVLEEAIKRGVAMFKERAYGLRHVYIVSLRDLEVILKDTCINIDKVVTMDISRLSRFNYSLNMKAGMRVINVNLNKDINNASYEEFSPFTGSVKIKPVVTGTLEVLDRKLNLTRGEIIKLEAYLGVYLVVKNIALPVDISDLGIKG